MASIIQVLKPVNLADMNDDFQETRVLAQEKDSYTVEVTYYPLVMKTNRKKMLMRTLSRLVWVLLLGAASPCLAEILIENVSPARAKELGIAVRSQPNDTAGVKVTLELKTKEVFLGHNTSIVYVPSDSSVAYPHPAASEPPCQDHWSIMYRVEENR